MEPIRLSKRMAELGLCSRREADEYIGKGWVKVDGVVVDQLGSKVLPTQKVTLDAQGSARVCPANGCQPANLSSRI